MITPSCIAAVHPPSTQARNEDTGDRALWRWTLPQDYLRDRALHRRLPGASPAGVYCTGLVSYVCCAHLCYILKLRLTCYRCLQKNDELGSETSAARRTRDHTNTLISAYTSADLWSQYGIVSDVIVRLTVYLLVYLY